MKNKYMCYNCKKKFNKIPPEKNNECSCSYMHKIVEIKKLDEITIKR